MSATIWQTLAVAPTADVAAIRRAYAAQLKITRPEDDPEGFKALRAAYELALRLAKRSAPDHGDSSAPHPAHTTEQPPTPPPAAQAQATEPSQPQIDPELEKLRNSFQELATELSADQGSMERAQHALTAMLQSPALHRLDMERQAEQRLAHLLGSSIPRSDPFLVQTAQRFGWLNRHVGTTTPAIDAILARLHDLAFLQSLQEPQSPYSRAFRGLQRRKLPVWSWIMAHVPRKRHVGEYQLLHMIRVEHPGLLSMLDPKTLEWWDRLASRPQPSALLMLTGIALSALFGSIAWLNDMPEHPGLNVALLFAGLVVWRLFLLDWPRVLIRKKWPVEVPAGLRVGWLPLCIACLATSLLVSGWMLFVLIFLALIAVQWSLVVRHAAGAAHSSNARQDLVMTVLVPQLALAFWWAGSLQDFPEGSVERLMIPPFALMFASAFGAPVLRSVWLDVLDAKQRALALAALGALSIVTCALLWVLASSIQWRPLCAVLVLVVVVLHRPLTLHLSEAQQKVRIGVIVALTAAMVVVSIAMESQLQARGVVLTGGGLVLIATCVFSLAMALWSERGGKH